MASEIIGRTTCTDCGFGSAHVKKSDKCHYRYCPDCGLQTYMTKPHQVEALLAKTRLDSPLGVPTPAAPPPAAKTADPEPPAPTPAPTPTPAKTVGLFGVRRS